MYPVLIRVIAALQCLLFNYTVNFYWCRGYCLVTGIQTKLQLKRTSNGTTATVTFSSDVDPVATYRCRINNRRLQDCELISMLPRYLINFFVGENWLKFNTNLNYCYYYSQYLQMTHEGQICSEHSVNMVLLKYFKKEQLSLIIATYMWFIAWMHLYWFQKLQFYV